MNRLTKEDTNKVCYDCWELCELDDVCKRDCFKPTPCKIPSIISKLAKYEDTGLEPDELQKVIEKQIPKKSKKMTYLPLKEDGWEYECPCCGLAVGRNDKYESTDERGYCESCGQALDWEVKE